MRRLAILLALAACGGGASRPAWPARQEPEADGGESLEPRSAAAGLAASPAADDDDDDDLTAILADMAAATAPAAAAPDAAAPAAPADEDVIFTEEITIEVTDGDDD